ncbi:hypothetical protein K437DRAFT_161194 [Tilletiaria anomala UBC 951]|uniref:Serine hydrolase domain-containing protein n=1 Tax=Tilletiaria anomala (strain ATCC 24038 / CBS 436.72 / UBC 951) TaxID=1037660 RepID=A0A066WPW3_TILAU|nr:uncharacterized protein K437DRAFT_161194 [Tilletiaria anomala UBC 951]KDN52670.1 hypothetical protein K437DRAFT_161194 [Tilletiaria anomala UBC 951]
MDGLRVLGLHGKGTNSEIMKAQVGPLCRAAEIEGHVQFESGPVPSVPYHNIERFFPGQDYRAWYEAPTSEKLREAQDYLSALLQGRPLGSPDEVPKPQVSDMRKVTLSRSAAFDLYNELSRDLPRAFDGVICFSQGCALAAGLLLQTSIEHPAEEAPIKFAIFICGSRPFSPVTTQRYNTRELKGTDAPIRITIPTLHIIGKQDGARQEGHLLASLCAPGTAEVLEFDGGHAPPRKSKDIQEVARAIKRLVCKAQA